MKEFKWEPAKKEETGLISQEHINKLREFVKLEKEVKAIREDITKKALEKMKETGTKKLDTEYFTVTYVAPTERKSIDSAKLKSDGLYDKYTKTTPVKESVRITFKEVD